MGFNSNVFTPRVDVTEDNENLYVTAEVPGVEKNDVKVSVVGDVLTISGEKKTEQRDEKKNYYRIERTQGSFSRSFTLPAEITVDKISADFKNGVLNITLPKTEEAKVVEKQIEIK
jgi:HSP20 family protein